MNEFIDILIGVTVAGLILYLILKKKREITDTNVKKTEYYKNIFEIMALYLAACWAVYVFVEENYIIPSREPNFVNISTHHEVTGKKGAFFIIKSSVIVTNPGKIRTRVLASPYNLEGFKILDTNFTDSGYSSFVNEYINDDFSIFPRCYELSKLFVFQTGKIFTKNNWLLEPQESYSTEFISLVPDSFDIIRFNTEILNSYNKKDIGNVIIDYNYGEKGYLEYVIEDKNTKDTLSRSEQEKYRMVSNITTNEFVLKENEYIISLKDSSNLK